MCYRKNFQIQGNSEVLLLTSWVLESPIMSLRCTNNASGLEHDDLWKRDNGWKSWPPTSLRWWDNWTMSRAPRMLLMRQDEPLGSNGVASLSGCIPTSTARWETWIRSPVSLRAPNNSGAQDLSKAVLKGQIQVGFGLLAGRRQVGHQVETNRIENPSGIRPPRTGCGPQVLRAEALTDHVSTVDISSEGTKFQSVHIRLGSSTLERKRRARTSIFFLPPIIL